MPFKTREITFKKLRALSNQVVIKSLRKRWRILTFSSPSISNSITQVADPPILQEQNKTPEPFWRIFNTREDHHFIPCHHMMLVLYYPDFRLVFLSKNFLLIQRSAPSLAVQPQCFSFSCKQYYKFLNSGIKILNTLKVSDNTMAVATFAPVIAASTVASVLGLTSQLNSTREVIITWPSYPIRKTIIEQL